MPQPVVVGVTTAYPSVEAPESGAFVQSLFRAIRSQGAQAEVVAPFSKSRALVARWRKRPGSGPSAMAEEFTVRRPGYWSVPGLLTPGTHLGLRVTHREFRRAVRRELPEVARRATFIYAHFFVAGWAALEVGEGMNVPVVLGLGESSHDYNDDVFGRTTVDATLARFSGIVAVSKSNETFCRTRVPAMEGRIRYLPNAVDLLTFAPRSREETRKLLGLPVESKIAIFVGHFIERKGTLLLAQALTRFGDVRGVFLGRGPDTPQGPCVLHAGPVPHDQVPLWLAASDVFVLPSLAEGMSNAIVEALACGLPVVVSDRSFNRDFLDSSCAEFVDPTSESSIADGIRHVLADDARRRQMAAAARARAERLGLADRARAILDFGCALAEARASAR